MKSGSQKGSGAGGFSLFEIAVAMTILSLISGAIFSILWQAADTATEIRELDKRDEEVSRFLALLRESIEHLPKDGTLAMTPAEESASGYPELTIGNSATAFTFGEIVGSAESTVIAVRPGPESPDGNPTFDLAVSRPDFAPRDTTGSGMALRAGGDEFLQADEEGRYWMPLLGGISAASWNFWDENEQTWLDEWTDTSKLPPLLAFSFTDGFRSVPLRVVFEVPAQVSDPPAPDTSSTAGGTGSSGAVNTSSRPRGGGDDGGGRPGRGDGSGRPDDGGARPGPGDGSGRPGDGGARPAGPPEGFRPGGGGTGGGRPGGGGGGPR